MNGGVRQQGDVSVVEIERQIDLAHVLSRKSLQEGVEQFKHVRRLLSDYDPVRVSNATDKERGNLDREAVSFEKAALKISSSAPERKLVLISDSLGLPRTGDGEATKFETTYSGLILAYFQSRGSASVRPLCRRYATSEYVVDAVSTRVACDREDLLIHVGLNDCAVRMFQEKQRIALGTLLPDLRQKILRFSQVYRSAIINSDFDHTYTSLLLFRERLEEAATLALSKGARSVSFATIVLPPIKFGASTPQMAWNFTRYNMVIYDLAKSLNCHLIDIDRLCWEHGTSEALGSDGMHLSAAGHRLMADAYVKAIGDC